MTRIINIDENSQTLNIQKFGGSIYYVSTSGSDTSSGTEPESALLTIGAAIGKLTAGDAISIKAGTYTETGLDLNVNNCEMWFEIGAIIDPASGTALTISGNYCKVLGQCMITPNAAVGVLASGTNGYYENIFINGGTSAWQITGVGNELRHCRTVNASAIGFDIQAGQTRLTDCNTGGNAATYGYKITGGVDQGLLCRCTSVNHATSGF